MLTTRRFTTSDGLGHETVRDIAQAPDGSVWFATWGGGVSRYDGTEWTTYTVDDGLAGNMVRALLFDERGGLWAGTSEGIGYFDRSRWVAYTAASTPGLEADSIFCITRLRSGEIWFGPADTRVQIFTPSLTQPDEQSGLAGVWTSVDIPGAVKGEAICDILEADDGTIWLALNDYGIARYKNGDWKLYAEEQGVTDRIRSFVQTNDGTLWAAGTGAIHCFEGGKWVQQARCGEDGACIAQRKNGDLVLGTIAGLRVFRDGKWHDFELEAAIKRPRVEAITGTEDGCLWVGSKEGVIRVSASAWSSFARTVDGVPLISESLYVRPESPPLALDVKSRLCRFELDEWTPLTSPLVAPDSDSLFFVPTSDEAIWVYHDQFVRRYSMKTGRFEADIALPETFRYVGFYRSSSGRVWVLGRFGVLEIVNDAFVEKPLAAASDGKTRAYCMTEAPDGSLWFGVDNGIEHWEENGVESVGADVEAFRRRRITDICFGRDGRVWFAVPGSGLVGFDGETWRTYTSLQDGLLSDNVTHVYEASDGTLWVGFGSAGVASFRDEHWVEFIDDVPLTGNIRTIGESPKGTLWFGRTPETILRYQPSQGAPDTQITACPDEIAPSGVGVIGFDGFDAWKETRWSDLEYSYRFVGLARGAADDTPWSAFTDEKSLITPHLAPGSYRFEVRAIDKDRNIDPIPASAEFRVMAPWYREPLFILSAIVATLITLTSLYFAMKHHAQLHREKKKAELATQVKSQFLAKMSHEIRTPLSGIVGNLELLTFTHLDRRQTELLSTIDTSAQTLLGIIGAVLDFAKIEANRLEFEYVETSPRRLIEEVFSMICVRAHSEELSMVADLDPHLPESVYGDPVRIRQVLLNLIGNAIKFTERGGVYIRADCESGKKEIANIRIEVLDTGTGFAVEGDDLFEEFVQEDSRSVGIEGTGLDLAICKRIVNLMGGQIGCEGVKDYGAKFWFTLPLRVVEEAQDVDWDKAKSVRIGLWEKGESRASDWLAHVFKEHDVPWETLSDRPAESHRHGGADAAYDIVFVASNEEDIDVNRPGEGRNATGTRWVLLSETVDERLPYAAHRRGFDYVLQPPFESERVLSLLYSTTRLTPITEQAFIQSDAVRYAKEAFAAAPDLRRLLVTDDTHTNRALAQSQLRELGLQCDVANDGAVALEMAMQNSYSVILMDCSMPVMDGYEFTRRLREWEEPQDLHTPVIAMTAHVVSGDEERCLAAGMDGYLPKPVRIETLATLLLQWIPGVSPQREPQDVAVSEREEVAISLKMLREDFGLTDPMSVSSMLDIFPREMDRLLGEIEEALTDRDRERLREAAHAAKGTANSMAALPLGRALEMIEEQSQSVRWEKLEEHLTVAKKEYARAKDFIMNDAREEE